MKPRDVWVCWSENGIEKFTADIDVAEEHGRRSRDIRCTHFVPSDEHLHLDNHNAIVAERNRQIEVAEKDRDRWKARAEKLAQRLGCATLYT